MQLSGCLRFQARMGARAVLYSSWGRQHGDKQNPELYPTHTAMTERLTHGVREYALTLHKAGGPVPHIAPAGAAFGIIHEDAGCAAVPFDRLFAPDEASTGRQSVAI